MRRIYFLLPSTASAKSIIDELLLQRVEWRHIHVLASPNVHLEGLPEATLTQRSDLLPALARGTAAGGATGMLAGLVAMAFPPAGLTIAGGVVVAMTLASAGFGAWAATMIGVAVPSTRLRRFEHAVEQGELLMMVDVPKDRVDEIERVIKLHHAEADVEGTDPTIPAFP
jgi:HAMP domain-containing protein